MHQGNIFHFVTMMIHGHKNLANDLVESIEQEDYRYQLSIAMDPSFGNKKIVSKLFYLKDFLCWALLHPLALKYTELPF